MPLAPYATVGELRSYMQDPDDTMDQDREAALLAASAAIEKLTSRDFGPGERTEYVDGQGARLIFPRAIPLASLVSVSVEGEAVAASITAGRRAIKRTDGRFWDGEVIVTYVTEGPVPDDVRLATLMTAKVMLESPAHDQNFTSSNAAGVGGGAFDVQGVGGIPRGARSLLEPHIRYH